MVIFTPLRRALTLIPDGISEGRVKVTRKVRVRREGRSEGARRGGGGGAVFKEEWAIHIQAEGPRGARWAHRRRRSAEDELPRRKITAGTAASVNISSPPPVTRLLEL